MKSFALALALLSGAATAAIAQDAIPDLKGTWSGKGKSLVFGSNPHHPGSQTADAPPRVRDIDVSYVVDGQEGRLAWGRSSSTIAKTDEPFAWAISADNKSIVGADRDGYFRITLLAPDRMDKCYVHNGTSPSGSIVATCYEMQKVK
jgi:opacity protein-like surface antigen